MPLDIPHLPTLIADPLRRADQVASSDPFLSLSWEYVGFANLIRMLTLSALMDYIQSPGGGDPSVEEGIKACQRPSMGSWISLLRNLVNWAEGAEQSLFLNDLPAAVSQITNQRMFVPGDFIDGQPGPPRDVPLLDLIVQQRNQLAIAHGSGGLSREGVQHVLDLVKGALEQVLGSMDFLGKIKLAVVVKWERNGLSAVQELVGPDPTLDSLDLSALEENPGIFLIREPDGLMQQLFPLFISQVSASPEQPSPDDCALLYDGISGRRVVYRGVHRRQLSRANFGRIQILLSQKSADIRLFRAESLNWQNLGNFSALLAHNVLDTRLQTGLFSPALYIERTDVGNSMRAFLASELPALILSGGTGMGKTSFLLAEVHRTEMSAVETGRRVTIYLDAAESLPAHPDFDFDGVFEQHLRLAFPMREALETLNRQAAAADAKHLLLLVLDGVERHLYPARVLESAVRFVERHRDIPCFKVVIALRDVALDVLERQVEIPVRLFYTERSLRPDGKDQWRPRLTIGLFSFDELQRATQRGERPRSTGPNVADIGTGNFTEILRHPLFLSLYLTQSVQLYGAHRPQPLDLVHSFVQERVLDKQGRGSDEKRMLIAILADQLFGDGRTTIPLERLADSNPIVSHLLDAAEPDSPYVQLQADRILIESVVAGADGQPEIRLSFAWDLLFDYFVAWRTSQRYLDQIEGLMNLSEKANAFFPLIGPLTLRFADLLNAGQEEGIARAATGMVPEILAQVLVRLVSESLYATSEGLGEALVRVLQGLSQVWLRLPELVVEQVGPWVRLASELSMRNRTALLDEVLGAITRHTVNLSPSMAFELANAGRRVAAYRGQRDKELKTIETMVSVARRGRRRDLAGTAQMFEVMNHVRAGRYASATAAGRRAVNTFRRSGTSGRGEADAWTYVATAQLYNGNTSGALRSIQKARQLALSLDDPEIAADAAFTYGLLCHHLEEGPQSIRAHESAIAIYASRGDRLSEGMELVNLTDAYWSSGLFDEAVALGEKMLDRAPALGAEIDDVARICHANTLASLGEWRRADALYAEGIQIARSIDNRWDIAYGLLYHALLAFDERREWQADKFAEAIRIAEEINNPYLRSLGLALDTVCRIESESECARDAIVQLDMAEEIAGRTGAIGGLFYAAAARCLALRSQEERQGAAAAARRVMQLHASHPYIKWRPELGVVIAARTLCWAVSGNSQKIALARACSHLFAKAYAINGTQRRERYLREPWINRDLIALGIQQGVVLC